MPYFLCLVVPAFMLAGTLWLYVVVQKDPPGTSKSGSGCVFFLIVLFTLLGLNALWLGRDVYEGAVASTIAAPRYIHKIVVGYATETIPCDVNSGCQASYPCLSHYTGSGKNRRLVEESCPYLANELSIVATYTDGSKSEVMRRLPENPETIRWNPETTKNTSPALASVDQQIIAANGSMIPMSVRAKFFSPVESARFARLGELELGEGEKYSIGTGLPPEILDYNQEILAGNRVVAMSPEMYANPLIGWPDLGNVLAKSLPADLELMESKYSSVVPSYPRTPDVFGQVDWVYDVGEPVWQGADDRQVFVASLQALQPILLNRVSGTVRVVVVNSAKVGDVAGFAAYLKYVWLKEGSEGRIVSPDTVIVVLSVSSEQTVRGAFAFAGDLEFHNEWRQGLDAFAGLQLTSENLIGHFQKQETSDGLQYVLDAPGALPKLLFGSVNQVPFAPVVLAEKYPDALKNASPGWFQALVGLTVLTLKDILALLAFAIGVVLLYWILSFLMGFLRLLKRAVKAPRR